MTIAATIGYILFKLIIPAIFSAAAITFLWGVFLHFIASADGELSHKGSGLMLWGLLAFLFMALLWWVLHSTVGSLLS